MLSTKRKDDLIFDLEELILLRLPENVATNLRNDLATDSSSIKDKLSMNIDPDSCTGTVMYGDTKLHGKVVDLPCILEALKTTDKKMFYKSGDLCQMLLCSETELGLNEKRSGKQKYPWDHGITPPMKNVRKRRFRRVLKKKYLDMPDIEKEVRRLFRMDAEAVNVQYEVIPDPADADGRQVKRPQRRASPAHVRDTAGAGKAQHSINEEDLFGELSSEEDETRLPNTLVADFEDEDSHLPPDGITTDYVGDGDSNIWSQRNDMPTFDACDLDVSSDEQSLMYDANIEGVDSAAAELIGQMSSEF